MLFYLRISLYALNIDEGANLARSSTLNATSNYGLPDTENELLMVGNTAHTQREKLTRADTTTSALKSVDKPGAKTARTSNSFLNRKTNIIKPADSLIRSEICEVLNLNEDLLTNFGKQLTVESKLASTKFK
jgi:hypothetical protein